MRRHVLLKLSPDEALLQLLLLLSLAVHVLAVCPPMCQCTRSHREVDCSCRGLKQFPDGLQHNTRSLNLSHNRIHNLDGRLTDYTHLRLLDVSHNRLSHLPSGLPRSLWHLHAASNRIQLLDKNDTVYQWNLRTLDLSDNKLERAIFINNTLINLRTLNLSHNQFWTLPTNMPAQLETIDASHNLLVKVLPGSLDRLLGVTNFYLHANRFSTLPFGLLDKMASLRVVTLGDNPWACHLEDDVSYLLDWTQRTPARVLGCPCHTQPVCGGVRPGRTGGWHFASYNLPPLAASAQDHLSTSIPHDEASVPDWWYQQLSVSAMLSTPHGPREAVNTPRSTGTHLTVNQHSAHTDFHLLSEEASPTTDPDTFSFSDARFITETPMGADVTLATDRFFTTESPSTHTKKTTTLRTRSVRRQNKSLTIGNNSPALVATCSSFPSPYNLGLLALILQQWHAQTL